VGKTVQMANVALSDGIQLVDDTIRSILSRDSTVGSASDLGMMKVVVGKNAHSFAVWLAGCLECVAGCDPSDNGGDLLEVLPSVEGDEDQSGDGGEEKENSTSMIETGLWIDASCSNMEDDIISGTSDGLRHYTRNKYPNGVGRRGTTGRMEDIVLHDLCTYLQVRASKSSYAVLTLAVVEMCRLAERHLLTNMNQSIRSSTEEASKAAAKGNKLFGTTTTDNNSPNHSHHKNRREQIDPNGYISNRFLLASSRITTLYAIIRGNDAFVETCQALFETCLVRSDILPSSPTDSTIQILEVVKRASMECAEAFGGKKMAGPVPNFSMDGLGDGGGDYRGGGGSSGGRGSVKGLHLNVARIFTEKIQVYPHPRELVGLIDNNHSSSSSRSISSNSSTAVAVITILLKVTFKAWAEQARHVTFTSSSYRQIQVDVEFLRFMLPHYVGGSASGSSSSTNVESLGNLLDELMLNVGERCMDVECVGVTEYYDESRRQVMTPLGIVIGYLVEENSVPGGSSVLEQFLIREEKVEEEGALFDM